MFRTLSLGDSISKRARGEVRLYTSTTEGADSLNIKDQYQGKEFGILCMGRCKSLESLNSFLSYAPQLPGANLVSLFILLLAFPQLLSNHHREWQHPLDPSFGSLHSHLEVRKCWWLWHLLFINMAGDIFISQSFNIWILEGYTSIHFSMFPYIFVFQIIRLIRVTTFHTLDVRKISLTFME